MAFVISEEICSMPNCCVHFWWRFTGDCIFMLTKFAYMYNVGFKAFLRLQCFVLFPCELYFFWLNDTRYMLSSYISLDSKKCHDNKQTFLLSKTSGVQHDIVSQVVRPTKHIYQVCRSLYSWSQRICLVRICFPPGCCLHVRYYFVWCDWCLQLEWPHQMSYLVISSLKGLSWL